MPMFREPTSEIIAMHSSPVEVNGRVQEKR